MPKIIKGGRKKGVGFCIISLKIKGGNIPTKKAPPLRKKASPLKSDPLANLPLLSQSVTWDAGWLVIIRVREAKLATNSGLTKLILYQYVVRTDRDLTNYVKWWNSII